VRQMIVTRIVVFVALLLAVGCLLFSKIVSQ
jgi:hypothetical protein